MKNITTNLGLENQIRLEDVPNIDLYMDQVIQLFENKFKDSKRNDDEKVMTKTMINNYAKGKLFFPIQKKKYSKEHILLISLIYQLKGVLSINDIKKTLADVNSGVEKGELDLDEFYGRYLDLAAENVEVFLADMERRESGELDQVLLIASLVNMSNMYRRAAEKLVDGLGVE